MPAGDVYLLKQILHDWNDDQCRTILANCARRLAVGGKVYIVEMVIPSLSILAEPSVAVVDSYAARHNTQAAAQAYLNFLYSPEGQTIIAKNFYRPRDPTVAAQFAANFPQLQLLTVDKDFGGRKAAQQRFFASGGMFDQMIEATRKK